MKLSYRAARRSRVVAALLSLFLLFNSVALAQTRAVRKPVSGGGAGVAKATVAAAEEFVKHAEQRLAELNLKVNRASWVQENFITDDTELLSAEANNELTAAVTELALAATRFDKLKLPYDTARKIGLLKLALTVPAPTNPAERDELTKITASLSSDYGKGKYCPDGEQGKCLTLSDMEPILAESRDPEELKRIWLGWHAVAPPYKQKYT
ncbi:MAG TPA: M2 family metallopeptidase, partial [Pyrinomonadaceae bacterium]|nr:M2 family metallopeptidase [Pyrinomonadaceae bacterium]